MATAFWIADRLDYIREAAESALSLKRHMPDVTRELWTPHQNPQLTRKISAFDELRILPARESEFWFVDAVRYFGFAVESIHDERLLYLDTDTHVCADLSDIFKMLDRFDVVGAHAPGRKTAPGASYVPDGFPEINVGVNGIRRNPQTLWLVSEWYTRMKRNPQNNDQPALRSLLWDNAATIRLGVLPPEYNCRWGFGGFARYEVKVLHGRPWHNETYEGIAGAINARKEMRAWVRGALP
jgi:hypothetical protein